jgi:hypothetical protein
MKRKKAILLDWWIHKRIKKAGLRIILQFPQRYFWGIRVPQKYLYVICVLGVCSIGNHVTDYSGLSERF